MWSFALYNLRTSPKLFWRLTPRQYHLLVQRHREDLVHREMVAAFTTSAVVNHSFSPPEKPIPPSEWMPNYQCSEHTPQAIALPEKPDAKVAFDSQVAQLTAEMKAYAETSSVGPALRALGYGQQEPTCQQIGHSK